MSDATSFFSTTEATLDRVYRQHLPDFQAEAAAIMDKRNR
jgi:hypothetical protein